MRRAPAVLLAALLVVGLLAPAANARSASRAADYSKIKGLSQARYETVRESYEVPMADGVELYVEVVRPDVKGRFATILELSPYHGTLADRSGTRILPGPPDGLAGYFGPRGYAVVFVDLRGTGRSGGCLDHMGPMDQSDAHEIVEWAASQPWSNGRVGMTGHSYVGSTPMMAAAQNPPSLKTIVPSAGIAQMYDHQFQDGVPYYLQWMGPVFAYWQLTMERYASDSFGLNIEYAGCGATQSAAVNHVDLFTGRYVDWHAERDFRKGATRARIPVFMVQGLKDGAVRPGAIDWFLKRGNRRGDKFWLGQWDHGSGCCPNRRGDHWTLALHAWFDKHLQRRNVKTGPPVEVFLNTREVFASPRWPGTSRTTLTLHPDAEGALAPKKPDEDSVGFVSDPLGFVVEQSTGAAGFETGEFQSDTFISGMPKLRLAASVTLPEAHLLASLYDVGPNGSAQRIGQFASNVGLRNGVETYEPATPGEVMILDPAGWPMGHVLKKGHKLRLRVAASNPDKVPVFAAGNHISIHVGGDEGTRLRIPVVRNPRFSPDPLN